MFDPKSYEPPAAKLPALALADGLKESEVDAAAVVNRWLATLQTKFDQNDFSNIESLFVEECWWRDQIALTFDTRALNGPGAVSKYLTEADHGLSQLEAFQSGSLQPVLLNNGGFIWIQSGFTFSTKHGSGQGILHLVNVSKDEWRAWIVLTQLQKLNEEGEPDWNIHANGIAQGAIKNPATNGVSNSTTTGTSVSAQNGTTSSDYQVVIVGAGQSGLALAAELKNKGINYLIIDRNARVGDSWRARYKTITSHTPTYTDHYPFLRFPENYPKWLNQEKITNWQESYAAIMELNLQLSTEITHIQFSESSRQYTINIRPSGTQHPQAADAPSTLTSRHVVLASGMFGLNPKIPQFPSQNTFKGQLYHAKHHSSASLIPDLTSKKIVIIGAGTSAHDIAEDFAAHHAGSITMVQRGAIIAVSRPSKEKHLLSMWNPDGGTGMTLAEADLVSHSFPLPVLRTLSVGQTMAMCAEEKEMLDKLTEKGMRLKRGETGQGLIDHQYLKGGHFYIDQGAWKHIADGTIQVKSCARGVTDIGADGVTLADGRVVPADVVVLATGYERCWTTVRDLLGEEVLEKVGEVGGADEEAERIAWWRPTKLKGFWYMTGSFMWVRQFSALLALQIQAVERGVNGGYWEGV